MEAEANQTQEVAQEQPVAATASPAQETGPSDSELLSQQKEKLSIQLQDKIIQSFIAAGIGRNTAKKVTDLIVDGHIEHIGVIG